MREALRKLIRFSAIYGPRRALFKAAGRLRFGRVSFFGIPHYAQPRDIGIIGCGQFAFATIGYAIVTRFGKRIAACFDTDPRAAATLAQFYDAKNCKSADAIIGDPAIKYLYIASNHSTHADYAIAALQAGKDVYVEKPIAVTTDQLQRLLAASDSSSGRLYAGYNRPFSPALLELKSLCERARGPLTLTCTVIGHTISRDHWYRDPAEGTRICGNLGHWLDLAVHIVSWRERPRDWQISCRWSNAAEPDDNLAVTLTSSAGDLVSIVMTSRSEPFEGVLETLTLQWADVIASIDDFRSMTVRIGPRLIRKSYRPKNVGHVAAILQPFEGPVRDFREVVHSTEFMLAIAEMVRDGVQDIQFSLSEQPQDVFTAMRATCA